MGRRLIGCVIAASALLEGVAHVEAAPPPPAEEVPGTGEVDLSDPVPVVPELPALPADPPVGEAPSAMPPSESMGPDTKAAATVAELIESDGLAQQLPVVDDGTFALDIPAEWRVPARVDAAVPLSVERVVEGDDKEPMRSPDQVAVSLIGSETAAALGIFGFGFEVASTGRDQSVRVEFDYSAFRDLYGANFAERLQLVRFPSCDSSDRLQADCSRAEVVAGFVNDVESGTISAIVPVDFDPFAFRDAVPAPGVTIDNSDVAGRSAGFGRRYRASGSGGSAYGVSAGVATEYGSYLATPLAASSSWSVGMSMGSFQWSYPVPSPPTGWGEAPSVSMSYNSVAVDGVVSDQNNQNGLLGAGWSLDAGGFIERHYKTCNNDGGAIGDFCWFSDNATIVLNGRSSELVFKSGDPATWSEWRLKNDPGWKVVRQRGSSWANPSSDSLGEIWWVYSPDGTEYQFGARRIAGGGDYTESVWHMPVYGNHAGEPCNATTWCQQAWRWNLDRVKDRFGNVTHYMYTAERNNYSRGGAPAAVTPYIRGGWLREIRYGTRIGDETTHRNIIRFNTKERCFSTNTAQCLWYGSNSNPWFPDAPIDKRCADGSGQCPLYAPAFWTERALDSIETFVFGADQMGSTNLVGNSNFEGGGGGWSALNPPVGITNWTVYGQQPSAAKDGSSYLATNVASPGGSVFTDLAVAPQQGVPYSMTAWVRSPSGTPITGQMVLWGLWGTAQNAAVGFVADGSWKPVTLQFTPSATNNTSMRAQFYIDTTGADLNIDLVSVMPPWQLVDRIKPTFEWPDPNGALGGEPAQLWLRTIARTGKPNGPAPVTVPDIRFESTQLLDNRADAMTARMWRVTQVNDELGGQTEVGYGQPKGSTCTMPSAGWMYNAQDCYPRWSVVSGYAGYVAYARYYVGTVVRRDLVAGGPQVTTGYVYAGDPAYRYNNEPFISQRTWSDSRGYGQVFSFTGPDGAGRYDRSWHWFFRGMHGDSLGQYGARTVNLQYGEGSWQLDYDWLNGREYRSEIHNASIMVTRDETFFTGVETALSGGVQAVRVDAVRTKHASLESGGGYHVTQTRTTRDEFGFPVEVVDDGSISASGDETCTFIQYARNPAVTNAWLLDLVSLSHRARGGDAYPGGLAGECNEAPTAELGYVYRYYDGQPHHQATTAGFMSQSGTRASGTSPLLVTSYAGDGAGHVTQIDGPLPGAQDLSSYFYVNGVRWAQRDATGHTTSQDIDPARGTIRYTVDWNDTLHMPGAFNGADRMTVIDSDALGRTSAVQLPGDPNPTLRFAYSITKIAPSWTRSSTQITDGVWRDTVEYFDGLGRPKETQSSAPNGGRLLSAVEYDGRSHVVKSFDTKHYSGAPGAGIITPGPFWSHTLEAETRSSYDDLGRVINTALYTYDNPVVRNGSAVQTATVYDGHWTTVYPAVGSPTSTHVNPFGQVDASVDYNTTWAGGMTTSYTYDPNGNLASTTDPRGNITSAVYDNFGRVTERGDRDRGTTTMAYNPDGSLATMSDQNSSLAYETDRLGRITAIRANSILLEQYTYDAAGEAGLLNYASSFSGGAELRIDVNGYDARRRPTGYTYTIPSIAGFTDTNGLAATYNFNTYRYRRDDQMYEMSYPTFGALAAEQVTVGYNSIGNPVTLTGSAGPVVGATVYTNQGRLDARTYGSTTDPLRVVRTYGWDVATGHLQTMRASQNGVDLQLETMAYDARGNLLRVAHDRPGTADDHNECYGYDGRSRLVLAYTTSMSTSGCSAANGAGPAPFNHTYAIDQIGNLTTGPAGTYTYNPSGANSTRPHAPEQVGGVDLNWNPDGTLMTRAANGSTDTYAWDAFDRLSSVTRTGTGAGTTSMIYYPGGQRALMKDSGGVHLYFDGYGERHATITTSGTPPVVVGSKTFDANTGGFVDWYGATVSTTSTPTRTGAGALQVSCPDGWCGVLDTTDPAQPVTAGKQYTVSMWARAATTAANVLLNVEWIDGSGNNLSVSQLRPGSTTTTGGWTQIAGSIVAPAGAARARVGVKLDNNTSVGVQYFDDFTLTESTVTVASVAMKGFESSTDGFAGTNQASVTSSTVHAHTGTHSLAVTPTGGGWNVTDTGGVTVSGGGVYQLTGWGRRTGWGTFVIEAEWRNSSNTVISTEMIGEPDMGEDWKPFATANLTAPAGAASLRVRFTGWTTDLWFFDDLAITAITPAGMTSSVSRIERRSYQLGGVTVGSRTRDTIGNIDVYHSVFGDVRGSTTLTVERATTTTQTQWYHPYGAHRGTPTITATDRGYIGQYEDTTTALNYLNNRYHDATLGIFLTVDPLVARTGEPYLYGSGNPTTLSDPTGLMPDGFSGLSVSHNEFGGWTVGSWGSRYETNWRNQTVSGWDRDAGQMSFPAGSMQANVARQRGACYHSYQPFMCMAAAMTGGGMDAASAESLALDIGWAHDTSGAGGPSWVDSGGVVADEFDVVSIGVMIVASVAARGLLGALSGGAGSSGPGGWAAVNESMSARAAAFQAEVTGGAPGMAYRVGGVSFDGFSRGALLEAKGPGYARFVSGGEFKPWFSGADAMVSQAQRQLAAAGGVPVRWVVAEPEAAVAIRNLFGQNGITGISVVG